MRLLLCAAGAWPLPAAVPSCATLEVMHVQYENSGMEVGVSWFFHTVGSGFGYCTSAYGKADATAALTFDTSDVYNSSESGAGGCGQFSHSVASPQGGRI